MRIQQEPTKHKPDSQTVPRRWLRLLWLLLIPSILLLLSACSAFDNTAPAEQRITVFAAASLVDVFSELGQAFEATYPNTRVIFSVAGSQQLAQQLAQGAPADVFASANTRQMHTLIEQGRVAQGTDYIFARNQLTIVLPADNPAAITSLEDLATPGVRLILAAEDVPVGTYTLEFLDQATQDPSLGSTYNRTVLDNVVSFETNVRSVLAKVRLGEADAGIVYASDVMLERDEVQTVPIPEQFNIVASYPIAVIHDTPQPELAQQFIDYVLSPAGQQILTDYGFLPGR